MARPSRDLTKQIAVRVSDEIFKEAAEIAAMLSRPEIGYRASKADAFRVAIERGFVVIREEAKAAKKKK